MNILVITQMYSQPDDVGDNKPTKTVNYFVKEWVACGHKVVVMHCPSKFPYIFYLIPERIKIKFAGRISTMVPVISSRRNLVREENGAQIYRYPMLKMKPGQSFSSRQMAKQTDKIKKALKILNYKPEAVIGHFANPSLELTANIAEYYNAKSSIVFHQDCTKDNITKYRIEKNICRVGAVGVRSIIEAYEVQKHLGLRKAPFVCCSGVPDDAVKVAAKECRKQDFAEGIKHIYVGSLIKRKHLDVVIKAFINSAGKKDTLNIIGGGPEEMRLRQLVKENHAESMITFTGYIPRECVLHEMEKAQIFTLISHSEAYGMVYMEAMLQGCLTIASKGGGFDGIIQDGINGFICKPGSQHELEKVYERIANMTLEERNAIGQAAIDTAVQYSEREVAKRYLNDILEHQR